MSECVHLNWFRIQLEASRAKEPRDVRSILAWRESLTRTIPFTAELIPLKEVKDWHIDEGGNIRHKSGQFFGVEGVRTHAGTHREVHAWDQPIFTQIDGGVLAMVARQSVDQGVQFLLQARAEPGNIGPLQFAPSLQCTWSNIRRAHLGSSPPLTELLTKQSGVRVIYRSRHNEEGGRFWQKSNENILLFLEDSGIVDEMDSYCWTSLSQIKELALVDNILSPYVKTVLAPI